MCGQRGRRRVFFWGGGVALTGRQRTVPTSSTFTAQVVAVSAAVCRQRGCLGLLDASAKLCTGHLHRCDPADTAALSAAAALLRRVLLKPQALQFGQRQVQRLIKVQRQLVAKLPDERTKRRARLTASTAAQRRMVSDVAAPLLDAVFARQLTAKHALTEALQQAKEQAAAELRARGVLVDGGGSSGSSDSAVAMGRAEFDLAWEDVGMASMRQLVLQRDRRADGRGLADLRPVNCEVGVLPIVHGSALFDRGSTQALCVATIGSPTEAPKTRTLLGDTTRTFMLHYSFPPFATNEVRGGCPTDWLTATH